MNGKPTPINVISISIELITERIICYVFIFYCKNMIEKITNSYELVKLAFKIIMQEKELLVYTINKCFVSIQYLFLIFLNQKTKGIHP